MDKHGVPQWSGYELLNYANRCENDNKLRTKRWLYLQSMAKLGGMVAEYGIVPDPWNSRHHYVNGITVSRLVCGNCLEYGRRKGKPFR